jgi:hypothetical protein
VPNATVMMIENAERPSDRIIEEEDLMAVFGI